MGWIMLRCEQIWKYDRHGELIGSESFLPGGGARRLRHGEPGNHEIDEQRHGEPREVRSWH